MLLPPTRDDILQKAAEGKLFDALFDEYGRHWFEPDDPTIALLASLHNEGAIDLLALVSAAALEPHKGHRFFQGQHLYQALITKLDASVEALMCTVETLRVAAGQDLAAGLPIEDFAKWCGGDPKRPAELLALIDANIPNADSYLVIAITKGVAIDRPYFTDRAYQFLATGTEIQRLGAINAFGQIDLATGADWDRLIAAFSATLEPDPGDIVRSALLQAVVRRLKAAPPGQIASLEAVSVRAITPLGQQVLFEAARTLAFSFGDLPSTLVDVLLAALLSVDAGHQRTIDLLDFALAKIVEIGAPEKARSFVEIVLAREEDALKFKQFDSLINKIFELGGVILEDWIIAWLRLGILRLCDQMARSMFGAGSDKLIFTIDFSRFSLADAEYAFLARKSIATFFLQPVVMTSILTSLMRFAPPAAAKEIEALLIDPVLMNYSGAPSDFLKLVADDLADAAAAAADRALQGLQTYIEGLRSIGIVRELQPSERERQLEWERHSDAMSIVLRAARKESIFAQLVTESVMLYGERAVNWIDHPNEPPRRMETELASIGSSFEMPRVDTVDPLGLQMMLLHLRAESPPV